MRPIGDPFRKMPQVRFVPKPCGSDDENFKGWHIYTIGGGKEVAIETDHGGMSFMPTGFVFMIGHRVISKNGEVATIVDDSDYLKVVTVETLDGNRHGIDYREFSTSWRWESLKVDITYPVGGENYLYRFFSVSGELLYVGISKRFFSRMKQHSSQPWVSEFSNIRVERFETWDDAKHAETLAIKSENPKYNKAENPAWYQQLRQEKIIA